MSAGFSSDALLVALCMVLLGIALVSRLLYARRHAMWRLFARRRRAEEREAYTTDSPMPSPRHHPPQTGRGVRHRRVQGLSPEDAGAMAVYPEILARAASGEEVDLLPAVVYRDMELPEMHRADFRQRVCVPFELSFFRAHCAALQLKLGELTWWGWLAGDGIAHDLFGAMVTPLAEAHAEAREYCTSLLEAWLLRGAHDDFTELRRELDAFEASSEGRMVTIAEVHAREAAACTERFSKDWLLASLLNTLMPAHPVSWGASPIVTTMLIL